LIYGLLLPLLRREMKRGVGGIVPPLLLSLRRESWRSLK
jgi:hypothetical protein